MNINQLESPKATSNAADQDFARDSPAGSRKRRNEQDEQGQLLNKLMTQCAGGFACQCSICTGLVRVERRAQVALTVNQDEMYGGLSELVFEGIPRDFEWLMRSLLPESDKVKGCELIFPDTVFFKKGKPVIIIKSDSRDFCLQGISHPKKLSLQSIYKDF